MEKKNFTAFWTICGIALTIIGFMVIPPMLKKITNKVYKKSKSSEDIDFDNLRPEIVKKDALEEEE